MATWTPRTIPGVAGKGNGRWGPPCKETVPLGVRGKRQISSDPRAQTPEAPSAPYQILTPLSCHLPPRRIIKSSASPLIFKRKSPWPERPAWPGPRVSGCPPPGSIHGAGGEGCWQPPGGKESGRKSGDARAARHPVCCPWSEPRVATSTEPPRDGQRPRTDRGAEAGPETPERVRSGGGLRAKMRP